MSKVQNKQTLLLDLDETIISTERKSLAWAKSSGLDYAIDTTSGDDPGCKNPHIIFARPHLKRFLDFVFSRYRVGVYTAATQDYALLVIKSFFGRHSPKFIFTRRHLCLNVNSKGPKEIASLLRSEVNTTLPQAQQMTERDTFLLDDNTDCSRHQPANVIVAEPFKARKTRDDFLERLMKAMIQGYLNYPTHDINAKLSSK